MVFEVAKVFYQKQPRLDVYFRKTATGHNEIGTHLHRFFELHCCTEGELHLVIEGNPCVVEAENAAIIFPYQPHSFTRSGGKGCFFTFDPGLIGSFANHFANVVPKDSRFPFAYDLQSISDGCDIYAIKSFLYAMCSEAAKLDYVNAPVDGRGLLEKIFLVTEEKYTDCDFSLESLSAIVEYDYGYLSKYFLKMTGIKYGTYLNQRRVALAVRLLQSGEVDNISDAVFASGYSSVRSFNRNFKKIEGKTPTEYMNMIKR